MRSRSTACAAAGLLAVAVGVTGCSGATAEEAAPDTSAAGSSATAPTDEEVRALFDVWNAALATKDAEQVTALYAPDAVLLPTLDADVKDSPDEIEGYFEDSFLPRSPRGVVTESHVDVIDADHAVNSGLYDFTVTDPGTGATSVVPARFTFVYEQIDGEWLISVHHSSVQPAGT